MGGTRKGYVTIQIEDWIAEAQLSQVKRGSIKYPYHKSICGVGYIGEGRYSYMSDKLAYQKWISMIHRCYDADIQSKQPTYIGCTVQDEWLNFQSFAKWFYRYYPTNGKKYELDKDIKVPGNKIYSSKTCIFVSGELNGFMTNIKSDNKSGYTGVSWSKEANKWRATIRINGKNKHLGCFDCPEDASIAYINKRKELAKSARYYYSFDYAKSIVDNIK